MTETIITPREQRLKLQALAEANEAANDDAYKQQLEQNAKTQQLFADAAKARDLPDVEKKGKPATPPQQQQKQ
jgi:hypothetical protein